jgi:alpha-L-fucosidase
MLGSEEKLEWSVSEDGLKINPPAQKPCDYAYVFKIVKN